MDRGESNVNRRKSHGYHENDDGELDLTLRLAISTGVDNMEENKHVPKMYDFLSLGGTTSSNKGSFSHEPGYEGVSSVSGAGMTASPLKTLGIYAPSGSSSGLSSHSEGFMPAARSMTPGSERPTQDERRMCRFCLSVSSPVWRKGPSGPQTLCNACGLKHARSLRKGSK